MSKVDGYGNRHRYSMGDRVKIWSVFGHPEGTIVENVNPGEFPLKYKVQYMYESKDSFTEVFEQSDLTIVKKHDASWKIECECGGATSHSFWCPKYN